MKQHNLIALVLFALILPCNVATSQDAGTMTNSIGMKLAYIPAGSFVMGSIAGEAERDEEELQHDVIITKPFYMGVYEVTQREYVAIMGPKQPSVFNSDNGGSEVHPVENVLWQEAVDFCKTLSQRADEQRAGRKYRLPTEAEWEYACRAGTMTTFHYGGVLSSDQANFNGKYPYGDAPKGAYKRQPVKVGSYHPNDFGLYDMHGNVAEWCADWYDKDYYLNSPVADPQGPPAGALSTNFERFYLVVRGGCWLDDARACRAAYRFRAMPRNKYRLIGFRVVCEADSAIAP